MTNSQAKRPSATGRVICYCPAYAWPHSLGGGKCDRSSDVGGPQVPAVAVTISRIIEEKNGVYFSQGTDGYYYVGLGLIKGHEVGPFDDPARDFCSTSEKMIARRYFEQHSGD